MVAEIPDFAEKNREGRRKKRNLSSSSPETKYPQVGLPPFCFLLASSPKSLVRASVELL